MTMQNQSDKERLVEAPPATGWGFSGVTDPEAPECLARIHQGRPQIKFSQGGDMQLANPLNIYWDPSLLRKRLGYLGCNYLEFKNVGQETFDLYRKFLDTHNENYLRAAERTI